MNILRVNARNLVQKTLKTTQTKKTCRFITLSSHHCRQKQPTLEEELPIEKFTESKAAKWKSFDTFSLPGKKSMPTSRPKAEPYVVSLSVAVFLAYFLWLREENDLDLEMDKPLYERLPSLEKAQLKAQIRNYEREGLDTEELKKRLKQVNSNIRKRQEG